MRDNATKGKSNLERITDVFLKKIPLKLSQKYGFLFPSLTSFLLLIQIHKIPNPQKSNICLTLALHYSLKMEIKCTWYPAM